MTEFDQLGKFASSVWIWKNSNKDIFLKDLKELW